MPSSGPGSTLCAQDAAKPTDVPDGRPPRVRTPNGPMRLNLSVLDPSPVFAGAGPADALRDSELLLAQTARMGYRRYWVTEHHAQRPFAGIAPEVLVAHLAARSTGIRVGTAAVLLSHVQPAKVAETFLLLDALHPRRIDLGIGSSTGVNRPSVGRVLRNTPNPPSPEEFTVKLEALLKFLDEGVDEPEGPPTPLLGGSAPTLEPWLVGTGPLSAGSAAALGTAYCFGHFFGPKCDGRSLFDLYRSRFQPSTLMPEPRCAVAISVICARTDSTASRLAASFEHHLASGGQGTVSGPFLAGADAEAALISCAPGRLEAIRRPLIVGDPIRVQEAIGQIVEHYRPDEVVIQSVCEPIAARIESYRLVMDVCA